MLSRLCLCPPSGWVELIFSIIACSHSGACQTQPQQCLSIKADYSLRSTLCLVLHFITSNGLVKTLTAWTGALTVVSKVAITSVVLSDIELVSLLFCRGLSIKPNYAEVYHNMGNGLQDQGNLEEAIASYNTARALKPDYAEARTQKLHLLAKICDWNSIREDSKLTPDLGNSDEFVEPFTMLFGDYEESLRHNNRQINF